MPKWLTWTLIVVVLGIAIWLLCKGGKKIVPFILSTSADTVEVIRDSVGVYHVDSSDKLVRVHSSGHVLWTFVPDGAVDSAVAIFDPSGGNHPFLNTRFEFSAGNVSSDSIVVAPDTSHTYVYRITIFLHPPANPDTVNADPGIIIED
jgi:hypothetical protein